MLLINNFFISSLPPMENIIQTTRNFALSESTKYGLPTLLHFELGEQKALELAKKLNADSTIVQLGVYLMDIKLGQAFAEKRVAEHVKMSSEAAKIFLQQFNLSDIYMDKILNCVEAHH
jgi:HD superfamily phosphodiesterase